MYIQQLFGRTTLNKDTRTTPFNYSSFMSQKDLCMNQTM